MASAAQSDPTCRSWAVLGSRAQLLLPAGARATLGLHAPGAASVMTDLHAEMLVVIVGLPPVFPVQKLSLHLSSSLDERTSHLQFYCNALVAFCAVANEPPPEGLMRFLGALQDPGQVMHPPKMPLRPQRWLPWKPSM